MGQGEEIRKRFEVELEREGLKPSDVVRLTGLPANTVYRILKGRTANPTVQNMAKIATVLHRPVDYLINGSFPWYRTNDEQIIELCNNWGSLDDDLRTWLKVTLRLLLKQR